jgi:hypothetical protein
MQAVPDRSLQGNSEPAEHLDAAQALYLLIDPLAGEPAWIADAVAADEQDASALQRQRAKAWQREVFGIALDDAVNLGPSMHPYLVALEGVQDPWLSATAELGVAEFNECQEPRAVGQGSAAHRIGGWLQSGHDPAALALTLGALLRLNAAARSPYKYLRLADRRVLALVHAVVGEPALSAALGGIERWVYLDCLGRYAKVKGSGKEPQALQINAEQWQLLALGHRVHPTIAQWLMHRRQQQAGQTEPPPRVEDVLRRALDAVQSAAHGARRWPHRFAAEPDHIAWAVLVMLHPQFDQRTDVAALLQHDRSSSEPAAPLHAISPSIALLLRTPATTP